MSALRSSRMLAAGTGVRILLAPVVMALVLAHSYTAAALVFLVAAATDWLDGRLARRWGVTTRLGAFLDTTADKLLVSTALIALVAVDRVTQRRTSKPSARWLGAVARANALPEA